MRPSGVALLVALLIVMVILMFCQGIVGSARSNLAFTRLEAEQIRLRAMAEAAANQLIHELRQDPGMEVHGRENPSRLSVDGCLLSSWSEAAGPDLLFVHGTATPSEASEAAGHFVRIVRKELDTAPVVFAMVPPPAAFGVPSLVYKGSGDSGWSALPAAPAVRQDKDGSLITGPGLGDGLHHPTADHQGNLYMQQRYPAPDGRIDFGLMSLNLDSRRWEVLPRPPGAEGGVPGPMTVDGGSLFLTYYTAEADTIQGSLHRLDLTAGRWTALPTPVVEGWPASVVLTPAAAGGKVYARWGHLTPGPRPLPLSGSGKQALRYPVAQWLKDFEPRDVTGIFRLEGSAWEPVPPLPDHHFSASGEFVRGEGPARHLQGLAADSRGDLYAVRGARAGELNTVYKLVGDGWVPLPLPRSASYSDAGEPLQSDRYAQVAAIGFDSESNMLVLDRTDNRRPNANYLYSQGSFALLPPVPRQGYDEEGDYHEADELARRHLSLIGGGRPKLKAQTRYRPVASF